jgi:hypothetical protein
VRSRSWSCRVKPDDYTVRGSEAIHERHLSVVPKPPRTGSALPRPATPLRQLAALESGPSVVPVVSGMGSCLLGPAGVKARVWFANDVTARD